MLSELPPLVVKFIIPTVILALIFVVKFVAGMLAHFSAMRKANGTYEDETYYSSGEFVLGSRMPDVRSTRKSRWQKEREYIFNSLQVGLFSLVLFDVLAYPVIDWVLPIVQNLMCITIWLIPALYFGLTVLIALLSPIRDPN